MSDGRYTKLGEYILALCKAKNLSLRQASLRSDLEAGTVSKILQRDGQSVPTPETLDKIARGLDGDYLKMMGLAGHLPPTGGEDADDLDAELYSKMQRLQDLIRQAARRDPAAASRLMGYVITSFDVMISLDEAELRREPGPQVEAAPDEKKVL